MLQNQWRTLIVMIGLIVAVGAVGSFIFLDTPTIQNPPSTTIPTSASSAISVTQNAGNGSDGRVKAGTFGITITKTPPQQSAPKGTSCTASLAIDLLLDTSNSMKEPVSKPRIQTMRSTLKSFIAQLPDTTLIAAQRFDAQARHVIVPTILSEDKGHILDTIKDITYYGQGGTHIKDGLEKAKNTITTANEQYPNKSWTIIMLTDGSPNPYPEQSGTDIAKSIKQMGVRIITIGVDIKGDDKLSTQGIKNLLKDIASSPADFYDAKQDDLSTIYTSLGDSFCQ